MQFGLICRIFDPWWRRREVFETGRIMQNMLFCVLNRAVPVLGAEHAVPRGASKRPPYTNSAPEQRREKRKKNVRKLAKKKH